VFSKAEHRVSTAAGRCAAFEHRRLRIVWTSLGEDIRRYINKSPENKAAGDDFKHRFGALLTAQLLCLLLYRTAHFLYVNGRRGPAAFLSRLNFLVHKVSIPPQSCIGPGCLLPHPAGLMFYGTAGRGLTLYSLCVCCPIEPLDDSAEAGPRLGNDVTVGGHAVVLGPITVGDLTKIGFKVRLDHDTPSGAMVVSRWSQATCRTHA
jgi:serine acetyltransferase